MLRSLVASLFAVTIACWTGSATAQVCPNTTCEIGETVATCAADCGIVDDFEDATVENWEVGNAGTQPTVQTTGGPLGTDDHYLQIVADGGGGANGRAVVFNDTQWSGNYTARGQTMLYLHARNMGPDSVTLRVWLRSTSPGDVNDPAGEAVSTVGYELPPDGRWRLVEFDISATGLTGPDVAVVLADVGDLRLMHGANTATPPETIEATLGFDNISNMPLAAICGDGVINGGDTCDGTAVGGQDCTDFGYANPDTLVCNADCTMVVTDECTAVCPNGTAEPGETCDDNGDSASCDGDCTAVSCGDGYCNSASEDFASCSDDCDPPDAGPVADPDAGATADAGATDIDAGSQPDASTGNPGSDAGIGRIDDGGCGCRATGTSTSATWLLMAMGALLIRRRRGRRAR